jgi:ParB family chromosome partitioning protein
MINHGARRFRASKLAGYSTIPAFVDDDYSRADQVVENLHRDGLTAREIAEYIGRELARGLRKADIARQISKSAAFVTQHAALLDLPDALATAFTSGRVRDVTLINELLKAFKARPADVASWLGDANQEVTRGTVQMLRAFVAHRSADGRGASDDMDAGARESYSPSRARSAARTAMTPAGRIVLRVAHDGRIGQLMLRRKSSSEGWGWVRYEDDASAAEVPLDRLMLLSIGEC